MIFQIHIEKHPHSMAGYWRRNKRVKMRIILFPAVVLYLSLISFSCKKDNPVIPTLQESQPVTLSLVDVSCSEAFIKITAADSVLPLNISLARNNGIIAGFLLTKTSDVILDTMLHPNDTYTYQTTEMINGKEQKSNELKVKTLGVTSDNFNWEAYTFGNYASDGFYDCAVLSENDIWCVGEFSIRDSVLNTVTTFNAVHWNGSEWQSKSILYNGYIWTIKSIYAFSSNDILFSAFVKYDGSHFISLPIPNILMGWNIKKVWGVNSNNYYVIGELGNIAHYQNGSWHKLISGTILNLNDIWGYYDPATGEQTILVAGGNIFANTERIILQIQDNQVQEIDPVGTVEYPLGSVWFTNNYKYFIAGQGYFSKYYNEINWEQTSTPLYFIFSIRGNGLNDIIATGGKGYVGHFNGISWTSYIGNGLEETSGNYYSASINDSTVAVAGDLAGGQAIVVIGRH